MPVHDPVVEAMRRREKVGSDVEQVGLVLLLECYPGPDAGMHEHELIRADHHRQRAQEADVARGNRLADAFVDLFA